MDVKINIDESLNKAIDKIAEFIPHKQAVTSALVEIAIRNKFNYRETEKLVMGVFNAPHMDSSLYNLPTMIQIKVGKQVQEELEQVPNRQMGRFLTCAIYWSLWQIAPSLEDFAKNIEAVDVDRNEFIFNCVAILGGKNE